MIPFMGDCQDSLYMRENKDLQGRLSRYDVGC